MRAPSNRRSDDEIVADITKLAGYAPDKVVRRLINELRTAPPPFTGNRKENVEYAETLHDQIIKLEATLKNAPNPFLSSVLFEERFWQLWVGEPETIEINASTRSYIAQERRRQDRFAKELGRLRAQCDKIIGQDLGDHGSTKYRHRQAAMASFFILETAASYTQKKLRLGCSRTGKFVRIASLFVEAATGEYDADLRRACETLATVVRAKK